MTNAGDGGAEWVTRAAESSSPTTAVTAARLAGTDRADSGACRISPSCWYSPIVAPNAACACATVPSAAT